MKLSYIISAGILLVLICIGIALYKLPYGSADSSRYSNPAPSPNNLGVANTPIVPPSPDDPKIVALRNLVQTQGAATVLTAMLGTPIAFYGKVVDEKGVPVEGATAICSAAQTLSGTNPDITKKSDANGLFSIDTHGLSIYVKVQKDGYYSDSSSYGTFNYAITAGTPGKHETSDNPAIFKLRKKGDAVALIEAHGASPFNSNGTPIFINLRTGKKDSQAGDIQIAAWVDDGGHKHAPRPYDWKFQVTVTGGGLLPRGGEYDFMAPDSGYQDQATISMPKSLGNKWQEGASGDYFLSLSGNFYARIKFSVGASGHFFHYQSFLNPESGSRNLEVDPAQLSETK